MTSSRSILIGAVLVAASLFAALSPTRATANGGGPYQLMNHSNTTANVGVFRIDSSTGEVSYCYLTGSADLNCTRWVK